MNKLEKQDASLKTIDLTLSVPNKAELRNAIDQYGLRKVFNTSGQRYRELGLKDKIDSMSRSEAIELLQSDGMLIRRPFVVDPENGVSLGK